MYVMDEPSIGLHPRDVDKLVSMLRQLRDKGNSGLVVEHDATVISSADHVIEIGPDAGTGGGEVCFEGSLERFLDSQSRTATMMRKGTGAGARTRRQAEDVWQVRGATANNLKRWTWTPQRVLVAVTALRQRQSSLVHGEFVARHPDAASWTERDRTSTARTRPRTGAVRRHQKTFAEETGMPAAHSASTPRVRARGATVRTASRSR